MTEQYPGSANGAEQDKLATEIQAMWEVGPEADDDEDAAVRPSRPESPRPDGRPYFPDRPPTKEQIDKAAEHGFSLEKQKKYYN